MEARREEGAGGHAKSRRHARERARQDAASLLAETDLRERGWYVVQVQTGAERRMVGVLERMAADELEECFCPAFATQKKVRGAWVDVQERLFPGYVIVVTRDVGALRRKLTGVGEFTRLLGMGEGFTPLSASERAWISAATDRGRRVMPMSMGVAEGDRVRVVSGPLRGHEAWIAGVDRRRSLAFIEMDMFGRHIKTKIGLAVLRKE